ncbi:MAG: MFS transporter [Desulfovibrio sp.]|nr:MFS transporter [Desulfovibrio sp.]
MDKLIPISEMPLNGRHWYILIVASLEQLIGGALSTIVGIMLPLIMLAGQPKLTALDQGILGASGLAGIAIGSIIIGQLMDAIGYLFLFRLCPLLIAAGSVCVYFSDQPATLAIFLFITGLGIGGGYSLDSGYISELMPKKWENFMVGLAKALCSFGFIGGAAVGYWALLLDPSAALWPDLILFIGLLGICTFLLRIHWYESPRWLLAKDKIKRAENAAREFLGPAAEVRPIQDRIGAKGLPWYKMFSGEPLQKVILSGITWACEGLGVYGFGVFLPILVMALGLQGGGLEGIAKVEASIKTTVFINLFIAAGFAIGLALVRKLNLLKLMGWCFLLCAISLAGLLGGYAWHWATWISFVCFIIFETALNAGPHLVTFIVPSRIYTVSERGAGMGIATMLGKVGAVGGVFFMPLLLHWGGITLVLWVSIIIQLIGAAITFIYGKKLNLL